MLLLFTLVIAHKSIPSFIGKLSRRSFPISSILFDQSRLALHELKSKSVHSTAIRRVIYEESRFVVTEEEYADFLAERKAKGWRRRFIENRDQLTHEIKLWIQEQRDGWNTKWDRPMYLDGDEKTIWSFDNQAQREKWKVTGDSIKQQGFSVCHLNASDAGYMLFHGNLEVDRLPEDGKIVKSGWAAVHSPYGERSFFRVKYEDWRDFTHLTLRVRGDGRTYGIVIRTPGRFDVHYHNAFLCALHTRGGPYWQTVHIPFSKFVLSNRGRVPDLVHRIPLNMVNSIAITMMDGRSGPFQLEVASIGLRLDSNFREHCAFEHYYHPKHKLAD